MTTETFDFGNGSVPAHRHENGGGWVADTAHVDKTAFVGPNAQVYGGAQVYDRAQVYGDAQVYGGAQVYDRAQVYGNAQVYGGARVYGDARVYGRAQVFGDARVYGDARVFDRARVFLFGHVVYCSGFLFGITVTPAMITIGCQTKTHEDFLKVTKSQAIKMGLPADEYSTVKAIVKSAIKQVTKK